MGAHPRIENPREVSHLTVRASRETAFVSALLKPVTCLAVAENSAHRTSRRPHTQQVTNPMTRRPTPCSSQKRGGSTSKLIKLPAEQDAVELSGLARLAGHFAHDFNNLLAIVGASAAVLEQSHDPDALEQIVDAAQRGRQLIRQMMAFGQRQPLQPMLLDLGEHLRESAADVQGRLPANVELQTCYEEDELFARLDPTQLHVAVMALVDNAVAAMPEGGSLSIDMECVMLSGMTHSPAARPHVMIAVSDCGTGMSAEVRRNAFKPFFTTNPQLAGMGLATVYGIVQQSGGALRLDTAPDEGTTVAMYFPVVGSVCEGSVAGQAAGPSRAGLRTILVVDDDAQVRRSVGRLLRLAGFCVIEADSGRRALLLARARSDELALVLTDVVMPGMNGIELARRLQRSIPSLPVLLTSGYAPGNVQGSSATDFPFIQKPSTREELLEAIHTLVTRDSGVTSGRSHMAAPETDERRSA